MISEMFVDAIAWNPEAGDLVLLAAERYDLDLVETALSTLPAKARGQVFLIVDDESDITELAAPGHFCVTWLRRDRGQQLRTAVDAWLGEMLPVEFGREHRVYAWMSGDRAAKLLTNS
ncbi:MAG: SIP domain-containing protein [Actinomycetota bacterium]|nr:SIP domain-containing protein [Actinomycetota bacterium]